MIPVGDPASSPTVPPRLQSRNPPAAGYLGGVLDHVNFEPKQTVIHTTVTDVATRNLGQVAKQGVLITHCGFDSELARLALANVLFGPLMEGQHGIRSALQQQIIHLLLGCTDRWPSIEELAPERLQLFQFEPDEVVIKWLAEVARQNEEKKDQRLLIPEDLPTLIFENYTHLWALVFCSGQTAQAPCTALSSTLVAPEQAVQQWLAKRFVNCTEVEQQQMLDWLLRAFWGRIERLELYHVALSGQALRKIVEGSPIKQLVVHESSLGLQGLLMLVEALPSIAVGQLNAVYGKEIPQVIKRAWTINRPFYFALDGNMLPVTSDQIQSLFKICVFADAFVFVEALLEIGANPDGEEGHPILHEILKRESTNTLTLGYLLCAGASPNSLDLLGRTPLHIAALMGLTESIEELLEAEARVNEQDFAGATPLQLAILSDHPEAVELLCRALRDAGIEVPSDIKSTSLKDEENSPNYSGPEVGPDLFPTEVPEDSEMFAFSTDRELLAVIEPTFAEWLEEPQLCMALADQSIGDGEYQLAMQLTDEEPLMSNYFLLQVARKEQARGDIRRAALIVNWALYVAKQQDLDTRWRAHLLSVARSLEGEVAGLNTRLCTSITNDRLRLQRLRGSTDAVVGRRAKMASLLTELTDGFADLFRSQIEAVQDALGPPPTGYAVIALGSLARSEMCRNSDIEWVIVVETRSEKSIAYFTRLAKLVELRVINMGETAFPHDPDHPLPPQGYSIDTRVSPLSPLRNLIGEPQELAALQRADAVEQTPVIANALTCCRLICGQRTLTYRYEQCVREVIDINNGRQSRAIELLRAGLKEFAPDHGSQRRRVAAFGVKEELLRPIQEPIAALALYYKLNEKSTADRILALVSVGALLQEDAERLSDAFHIGLWLRYAAHYHYGCEKEIIHVPDRDRSVLGGASGDFIANEEQLEAIGLVYRAVIAFHAGLSEWIGKETGPICIRWEDAPPGEGLVDRPGFLGSELERLDEQLAEDPNDGESLFSKGMILLQTKPMDAINLLERALQQGYLFAHVGLAYCYGEGHGVVPDAQLAAEHVAAYVAAGGLDYMDEISDMFQKPWMRGSNLPKVSDISLK